MFLEPLYRPVLSAISPAWALANAMVRSASRKRAVRLAAPVLSVGNIVAGGVGKTEVVSAIARHLIRQGKNVTIAARGYGSAWEKRGGIAKSYAEAAALLFPDEALVLLKKLEGQGPGSVHLCVGADRSGLLQRHWAELQPDVVLLDDGFQHFKLARDLDILVHDFSVPFPILREFPSVLNKAGLRVSFSEIPQIWRKKAWTRVRYAITSPLPLQALVFCGLGNPARFRQSLERAGVQILGFRGYRDHRVYQRADLNSIQAWQKAKGGYPLLTTLKDYVKWGPLLETRADLDLGYVAIDLEFLDGEKEFWETIEKALQPKGDPEVR